MPRMLSIFSWKRKNSRHALLDRRLVGSLSDRKVPNLRQLKYLGRVLPLGEYRFVKVLFIIIAINILFLGWRFYAGITEQIPTTGGTYAEALVGEPQYINPLYAQSDVDRDLTRLVYSGLLRYTTERKLIGDLAESYKVSKDGKTYRFKLRKNVVWHDRVPFTADDVLFTIRLIQDEKSHSPLRVSFKDVRVEKKNDYEIAFVLSRPFAPFLDLATTGILPHHIWSSVQPENLFAASPNLRPLGTGEWQFQSFKKESDGSIRSYTFIRNERYFARIPYLDKLILKFYPDSDTAIQALKNRHVDGVSFLPRALRDRLTKDKDLAYYSFNLPQYTAIFFNSNAKKDLESKAVRQALAYAIDTNEIIQKAIAGEAVPIAGPLLPGFLGYHDGITPYAHDPEKSKRLLETAGWKKDELGFFMSERKEAKNEEKRRLEVKLTTVQRPEHVATAELIKKDWEAIGVTTQVEFVEPSLIKTEVIDTRQYEAFLYGAIIGSDPDLYPFWHSSQASSPGLNLSGFSNAEADRLLEDARHITDEKERSARYRKFQEIVRSETPAIFLYSPAYNYVVARQIQGIRDGKQLIYPADRFSDLSDWYRNTKRKIRN
ncbi:hypothetical protein HY621_04000 [Candidatus Uhrbacteria bacterium]|nr:hypothetical protein [Candidatus Uhrbacteria bacterium]